MSCAVYKFNDPKKECVLHHKYGLSAKEISREHNKQETARIEAEKLVAKKAAETAAEKAFAELEVDYSDHIGDTSSEINTPHDTIINTHHEL